MVAGNLYELMGDLLTYPGPGIAARARRCRDLLAAERPEAARALEEFVSHLDSIPLERLEEVYTATFDLNPTCCPYAAYHLFGDGPKRSALMLKLQEAHRAHGLVVENELPDHVALLLALLARLDSESGPGDDLRCEVLAPTLEKMLASVGADNPYRRIIDAALLVVRGHAQANPKGGADDV